MLLNLQIKKLKEDLMSKLSKYGYYIQVPKNQYKTIWVDSPCSLSFSNKLPPIDKSQRFQYNSIYYRDDPHKPAKKIDQFQKPDLLLLQFRRNIRQAQKKSKNHTRYRSSSIKNASPQNQNMNYNLGRQKQIVERLCPKNPKKLKLQYDLYGNRSSFYVTQKQISPKGKQKKSHLYKKSDMFFTDSGRIDMSKPQNFNPGPGTYFKHPKKPSHNSVILLQKNKNLQPEGKKLVISRQQQKKRQTIEVTKLPDIVQKIQVDTLQHRTSVISQKQNKVE